MGIWGASLPAHVTHQLVELINREFLARLLGGVGLGDDGVDLLRDLVVVLWVVRKVVGLQAELCGGWTESAGSLEFVCAATCEVGGGGLSVWFQFSSIAPPWGEFSLRDFNMCCHKMSHLSADAVGLGRVVGTVHIAASGLGAALPIAVRGIGGCPDR